MFWGAMTATHLNLFRGGRFVGCAFVIWCAAMFSCVNGDAMPLVNGESVVGTVSAPGSAVIGESTCITVQVVDANTGQPVSGLYVTLEETVAPTGYSTSHGGFQLLTDASGNASYCLQASGFPGEATFALDSLAVISGGGGDASLTSNTVTQNWVQPTKSPGGSSTASTSSGSPTDLMVNVTASTPNVVVGSPFTLTIEASYGGTETFASFTTFTNPLPAWLTITSMNSSVGPCNTQGDGSISCPDPGMAPGGQETVTITATATAPGVFSLTATTGGLVIEQVAHGTTSIYDGTSANYTLTATTPPDPPTVSMASQTAKCVVPSLLKHPLTLARTLLKKSDCRAGRVTYRSRARTHLIVLAQVPRAGKVLPAEGVVAVTLGATTLGAKT